METNWIVTIPPLLVLITAFTTRNVIASLLLGITSAAFITSNYSLPHTILLTAQRLWEESRLPDMYTQSGNYDHAYTFAFLIILGIVIQFMTHSGGIHAYTMRIKHLIKNKKAAQTTSLLLSHTLFIDDYLSNLTVGAIMRPLTDHFAIPRAKLAFLLSSMSGPLCILLPATSWVAFILMQMQASGISLNNSDQPVIAADSFSVYLATLPYLFYPLFMVISAWFIVRRSLSFGVMQQQENIAHTDSNLFGGRAPIHQTEESTEIKGTLTNFLLPLFTFLVMIPLSALYRAGWSPTTGTLTWYKALQNADLILEALFVASCAALAVACILALMQRTLTVLLCMKLSVDGFMLMKNSLIVLLLAWTFSALLKNDLHTGVYLAQKITAWLPISFFPLACFIASTIISASTGSVWGTISIMLPLSIPTVAALSGVALPAALSAAPLLLPTLGAVLSGAVAGSHLSPITDASVMAASSAGAYHLDYVTIQIQYSLAALVSTFVCFLALSLFPWLSWKIVMMCGILLCLGILLALNKKR